MLVMKCNSVANPTGHWLLIASIVVHGVTVGFIARDPDGRGVKLSQEEMTDLLNKGQMCRAIDLAQYAEAMMACEMTRSQAGWQVSGERNPWLEGTEYWDDDWNPE